MLTASAGLSTNSFASTSAAPQAAVTSHDAQAAYERGDISTALAIASQAANAGSAEAAVIAGHIMHRGETGTVNLIEARRWYELAAAKGHPDALVALGEMGINHQAGLTPTDAQGYLTRAADKGRTDAMKALAELHRTGIGAAQDPERSQDYLKRASRNFDTDSTKKLADSYFESDPKKALELYEQAADAGNIEAAYIAGVMYAENFNIRPDNAKSAKWLQKAAIGGHAAAQADYGLLVYQGYGAPRSETDAARWFEKSAQGGDSEGQFLYAFTLAKGEGVPQDFEEAYYWLLKSGSSGVDDYDKDKETLKKRLEENVDKAVLDRARARVR